jgi:hypothetical protein
MDKVSLTDHKGKLSPSPQSAVLTPEQTKQVGGGLNPQPLPPREDRPSAKLE